MHTVNGGFSSFQDHTMQTISAGDNSNDVLLLPGSPSDYNVMVNFSGGVSQLTIHTVFETSASGKASGMPDVTLDTTGIQTAKFSGGELISLPTHNHPITPSNLEYYFAANAVYADNAIGTQNDTELVPEICTGR
jgi:hypothetical protein